VPHQCIIKPRTIQKIRIVRDFALGCPYTSMVNILIRHILNNIIWCTCEDAANVADDFQVDIVVLPHPSQRAGGDAEFSAQSLPRHVLVNEQFP
jgi:hypothetical protein